MVKIQASDYKIGNFYQGGYKSLEPGYSGTGTYTGFVIPSGRLGSPTGIQDANQIKQVNSLLNQGIIPIEVGVLDPNLFDNIPKQHFKEINRMAKLAGSDISVHAPMIEPSGIGEQGYTAASRELAEKQIIDVVDRTAPMNDKGGMSITIHISVKIPGTEYKMTPEGKKVEKLFVVNKETGKLSAAFEEEHKYYPINRDEEGKLLPLEKGTVLTPKRQLDMMNDTEWDNSISQLMHHKEDAEQRMNENLKLVPPEVLGRVIEDPARMKLLSPDKRAAVSRLLAARQFLGDTRQSLTGVFNKAYKFGSDDDRERLKKAADQFQKDLKKGPFLGEAQAIENLLIELKDINPQIYQPVEEYALDKSAQTFANVAADAFEKYKDKAPKINIEHFHPGSAFAYGKEMDDLINRSRELFVEKLKKEKGYSESFARKQAEKIIGVTLDVGHINIAKKKGFTDKDIMKEIEQISKHVKHVHLTDNFGYGDSHLAPGMGNVPFKEILEHLEKEGKGDVTKIVEAGAFAQNFGSPLPYTLEAFGSPIYQGGPSWNQASALYQGYPGSFGQMLPQINYETFGGGFARLPAELGGSSPGASGSRMSGRGME